MRRSAIMARIRSSSNKSTELRLCAMLSALGVRGWRRQVNVLGVRADIAFPRDRVAVFVDGCFWHWCVPHCGFARLSSYWQRKIMRNFIRDVKQNALLMVNKWTVVRIWEHDLRTLELRRWAVGQVKIALDSGKKWGYAWEGKGRTT